MFWLPRLIISTLIITAAVWGLLRFAPALPISSVITQRQTLFTVSGEGKITVVPDTGIVDLGLNLTRPSVKAAQTEVNTIINKITADLKKLGIADKDIKTSQYSIYPQYDYRDGVNRITGYQITANLTVTVRDLEKLNSAIDTATSDGANTVGGIQLTVADDRHKELVKQARTMAVAEAKAKAESLAQAAGITLGRVVNIEENSANQPYLYRNAAKLENMGMGAGGAPTDIQAGSTDITSSVSISYETR